MIILTALGGVVVCSVVVVTAAAIDVASVDLVKRFRHINVTVNI